MKKCVITIWNTTDIKEDKWAKANQWPRGTKRDPRVIQTQISILGNSLNHKGFMLLFPQHKFRLFYELDTDERWQLNNTEDLITALTLWVERGEQGHLETQGQACSLGFRSTSHIIRGLRSCPSSTLLQMQILGGSRCWFKSLSWPPMWGGMDWIPSSWLRYPCHCGHLGD